MCIRDSSGPAGYTAAIYASRADLKPVMYTGMEPGGQLTTTTEVDNFPGYPEGIDGPTMMVQLQQQAERFGTEVRIGMVTAVDFSKEEGGIHKVTVDGKTEIEAETVIISTGATAKYLGIPSEQKLRGGGVSACAVCDGFFYKGQDVAIVGAGDTAAEEATYLSNIRNHLIVTSSISLAIYYNVYSYKIMKAIICQSELVEDALRVRINNIKTSTGSV